MSAARGVKVKVEKTDPRPKRPKVDRGQECEALVRQLFALSVDEWFEDEKEKPDKEVKGDVVDNLTALFSSAIETTIDAATDTYLSTFDASGEDEDEEADVKCPKCDAGLVLEEDAESDDVIECPDCKHEFVVSDAESAET
jgi:DNA-directed RNA polymerase subunit RPC12/RpoP